MNHDCKLNYEHNESEKHKKRNTSNWIKDLWINIEIGTPWYEAQIESWTLVRIHRSESQTWVAHDISQCCHIGCCLTLCAYSIVCKTGAIILMFGHLQLQSLSTAIFLWFCCWIWRHFFAFILATTTGSTRIGFRVNGLASYLWACVPCLQPTIFHSGKEGTWPSHASHPACWPAGNEYLFYTEISASTGTNKDIQGGGIITPYHTSSKTYWSMCLVLHHP